MSPEKILGDIRVAVGDPSSGPIKDAWPLIEDAVYRAFDQTPKNAKETRVIKAQETPED
jgi:hypothetical protein